MRKVLIVSLSLMMTGVLTSNAFALFETATIYAAQDATVNLLNPNTVNNSDYFTYHQNVLTTGNPTGLEQYAYLGFDLSTIPDNAAISTAYFQHYTWGESYQRPSDGSPYTPTVLSYHVADDTWDQSTVTWNNAPTYSGILGSRSLGGSYGIRRTYFILDAISMDQWDESVDLLDDYLSLAYVPGLDDYPKSGSGLSTEHDDYGNPALYMPQLYLEYNYEPGSDGNEVPEPATMVLLGTGLVGMAFRKRFV